jgi:hypothetical protein
VPIDEQPSDLSEPPVIWQRLWPALLITLTTVTASEAGPPACGSAGRAQETLAALAAPSIAATTTCLECSIVFSSDSAI